MKNQVNFPTIENFSGNPYFIIYEVRVKETETGEVHTHDRFASRSAAEEAVQVCEEVHGEIYSTVWIKEVMVWL